MKAIIKYQDFADKKEREYLLSLLHTTKGKVASASRVGGIPLTMLRNKIKAYDIDVNLFKILDRTRWNRSMRLEEGSSHVEA